MGPNIENKKRTSNQVFLSEKIPDWTDPIKLNQIPERIYIFSGIFYLALYKKIFQGVFLLTGKDFFTTMKERKVVKIWKWTKQHKTY